MCLSTEEVGVPHAQKTTKNWDILLKGSLLEVDVHGVSSSKKLVEVLVSNVDSDTQANGGPDTVTTTNPVGEAEHVRLVNAELGDLLLICGEGDEVLSDGRFILCRC